MQNGVNMNSSLDYPACSSAFTQDWITLEVIKELKYQ